ncbi:glutathione S-transferase U18-like [Dendrobium catenatum]|uniref:glutathione S-transferase U18-like n=1 Tax=Dendrobium catenatum TaxID=906689 RepID=UPI0009F55EFB|nr:glutathione S-transferase U18-like [Dendrobium catenatum]
MSGSLPDAGHLSGHNQTPEFHRTITRSRSSAKPAPDHRLSKGKSFFGGDTINLVDISLGSYINWLKAVKIITGKNFLDKTKTPRLVEWAECFCSVEAAMKVLPEAEKLVEFRTFLKAKAAGRAAADPSSK